MMDDGPGTGRVFFDILKWPWPKHGLPWPRRAIHDSAWQDAGRPESAWRREGWHPVSSSKVRVEEGRALVSGDFDDEFPNSISCGMKLSISEVPFLSATKRRYLTSLRSRIFAPTVSAQNIKEAIAYRTRIAGVGEDVIVKAA